MGFWNGGGVWILLSGYNCLDIDNEIVNCATREKLRWSQSCCLLISLYCLILDTAKYEAMLGGGGGKTSSNATKIVNA